jgi:hypothetical protein
MIQQTSGTMRTLTGKFGTTARQTTKTTMTYRYSGKQWCRDGGTGAPIEDNVAGAEFGGRGGADITNEDEAEIGDTSEAENLTKQRCRQVGCP